MIDEVDAGEGLHTTWLIQVGLEDLYMIDIIWLMLT
jgi:hypothetical protein